MIRLEKLYIKGFKQPNREATIEFSKEPITVIYGDNGSGKTTLLRILQAIFRGDYNFIAKQGITKLRLDYSKKNVILTFRRQKALLSDPTPIKKNEIKLHGFLNLVKRTITHVFLTLEGTGNIDDFIASKSISFGVHRGISPLLDMNNLIEQNISKFLNNTQSIDFTHISLFVNYYEQQLQANQLIPLSEYELESVVQTYINYLQENIKDFLPKPSDIVDNLLSTKNHISKDFITIKSIEKAILNKQKKGVIAVMGKTVNAFFETIETFEQHIDNNFDLPKNIQKRVTQKKGFIRTALAQQNNSNLKNKLEKYIENFDPNLLDSKISRALLLNILEKAEEPNPALDSVNKLIQMFNDHLYYDKKLVVDNDRVYIDVGDGHSHNLEELSSGERNFLSMLTLFLILGQDRDFLIIDEPEISMNLKWQREFLPMISELNPQAQIIVASHSPAIASKNSNYLVELNPKKITDEV